MSNTNSPEILVIAVLYNTYSEAINLVDDFIHLANEKAQLLLIDNSDIDTPDSFLEVLRSEKHLYVEYEKVVLNKGYFGGAKYALDKHIATNLMPRWVIVCNVDIRLEQQNFFSLLSIKYLEDGNDIIAPRIWSNIKREDLNPMYLQRPRQKKMIFLNIVAKYFVIQQTYEILSFIKYELKKYYNIILNLFLDKKSEDEVLRLNPKHIYAPHGSFIIFKDSYFLSGGNLNHVSFLFGEEIFLGETARQLNLSVVYDPSLMVVHEEHASTGVVRSKKIGKYMKDANLSLYRHYFESVKRDY